MNKKEEQREVVRELCRKIILEGDSDSWRVMQDVLEEMGETCLKEILLTEDNLGVVRDNIIRLARPLDEIVNLPPPSDMHENAMKVFRELEWQDLKHRRDIVDSIFNGLFDEARNRDVNYEIVLQERVDERIALESDTKTIDILRGLVDE